jgi:localization factor PodJL
MEPLSSDFGELPGTEEIGPSGSFPARSAEPAESTSAQMLKAGGPHTAERRPIEIAGDKSTFIAAARRAAQAARRDAPDTINPRPKLERSAAGTGRRRRAVAASVAAVMLVLGSLQIATTLLSSGDNPASDGDRTIVSGSIPGDAQSAIRDAATAAASPPEGHAEGSPTETPEAAAPAEPVSAERANLAAASAIPEAPQPAAPDTLPAAFGGPLRIAAAQGDANAQHEVAVRYFEGRGVPQDARAAADWFARAAGQGLAAAQFRLGGLYEKGLGVEKDLHAAGRLYLAAGEAGHAKALHNLAVLHAEGVDGKPDYRTAGAWFRKAAAYGVVDSQYNLGVLYARGIGVERNLVESYKWFALAAREGDLEAARKRDNLAPRLDQQQLQAALQAVRAWTPQPQPDAAVRVERPVGGWEPAMPR